MEQPRQKLSAQDMRAYYQQVHRDAVRDGADDLAPVIHPGASPAVNRFDDYAHRLGMNKALAFLQRNRGGLAGASVLDLGCGRGRWVRLYGSMGARVTGVDISPDAIAQLQRELPDHRFLSQDLAALDVPAESFDVATSVTVLQHLPPDSQRAALVRVARSLKPGGYLVLLENVFDFESSHVFAHSTVEWKTMVEGAGLGFARGWGSNFDVPVRMARVVARLGGARRPGVESEAGRAGRAAPGSAGQFARTALAIASYPFELLCSLVPMVSPTHAVMIFRKP